MIIPWLLIGTAVAAAVPAAWWARRRARASGLDPAAPLDLALTIGLAALVVARLVALVIDVALAGALPDARALLTIGAGLSVPGAVLGGIAAGAWAARRGPPELWAAVVPPVALGLGLWSALSVVRSDVGAPVPVGVLEAGPYVAAAWWLTRTRLQGARHVAALAGVAAGVHLAGGLLRPAAPTVDGDIDVLLGIAAFAVAVSLTAGIRPRAVGVAAAAAGTLAAAVAVVAALTPPSLVLPDPVGDEPALAGAITSNDPSADPPAWDEVDLAAFVAAAHGKPVVVNFWASWCPPCHAEAPALARAATAMSRDVAFVGVLVRDHPARAAAFAARYRLPFPTVADGGVGRALGMAGLPTTVVLAPDGTVSARVVGGLDARGLAAAVARAEH